MVSLDTKIAMSIYINYVNGYPSIITYLYTLTPSINGLMSYKLFAYSDGVSLFVRLLEQGQNCSLIYNQHLLFLT